MLRELVTKMRISGATLLEDEEIAYCLEEIRVVVIFKTCEILRWIDEGLTTSELLCQNMTSLNTLYSEYREIGGMPLQELIDNLPRLDLLETMVVDRKQLLLNDTVMDGPSRYIPIRLNEPAESSGVEVIGNTTGTAQWSFMTAIGLNWPFRIAQGNKAANLIMDHVIDDLFEVAVEVAEHDLSHGALQLTEDSQYDNLIDECAASISQDAVLGQMIYSMLRSNAEVDCSHLLNGDGASSERYGTPAKKCNDKNSYGDSLVYWSRSLTRCKLMPNTPRDWNDLQVRNYTELIQEGIIVRVHRIPENKTWTKVDLQDDSEMSRIMRFRNVMVLSEDEKKIEFYTTDENFNLEKSFSTSEIECVCWGACTKNLQASLLCLGRKMHCFDSEAHAKRCFSLIGADQLFDIEVLPFSYDREEEILAAQKVSLAIAKTIHRVSSNRVSSNLGPLEQQSKLVCPSPFIEEMLEGGVISTA